MYEENINFSLPTPGTRHATDIDTGNNLTCKPNDIEKLSTSSDSTLLIVFDTKKSSQVANSSSLNLAVTKPSSNLKARQLKLRNFLKYSTNFTDDSKCTKLNKKYLVTDEYQTNQLKAIKPVNGKENSKSPTDIEVDDLNELYFSCCRFN